MTSVALSIVTVTRNDALGLRRTLESIRCQTVQPLEVIIVDGLSTDETQTVVRDCVEPTWQYIRESDGGVYDAMNKGWRAARGDYVQFLNSGDAWLDKFCIETWLGAMVEAPQAAWAVSGAVRKVAGADVVIGNIPHVWWRHALGLQSHCHQACFFAPWLLEALGGLTLELSFVADYDLVLRAGMIAPPHEVMASLVRYEGGGTSEHRAREIPRLLHRVRTTRLQLSGIARALDAGWMSYARSHQEAVWTRDRLRRCWRRASAADSRLPTHG